MNAIPDPRRIETYAREQMEEVIMAVCGRSAANPKAFRDWLRSLSREDLSSHYRIITDVPQ